MPPPKIGKKLTAAQIELLRRWIDQGAAWGKHWAFETPVRPAAAAGARTQPGLATRSTGSCWPGWRQEGLAPSPEAEQGRR